MKLLAIDTSTEQASVAVLVNNELISEEQGSQKTHAQLVLPMVDKLMSEAGVQLNQLDGIIFGCGPGSFTGLRIACSLTKGLAYAHDLNLIPVGSLAAIAWAARQQSDDPEIPVLAVLDARMNELYWGYYPANHYAAANYVHRAGDIVVPSGQSMIIAGTGIDIYWSDFSAELKSQTKELISVFPTATAMIRLVQEVDIHPIAIAQAQPVYIRNQVTQGDPRG